MHTLPKHSAYAFLLYLPSPPPDPAPFSIKQTSTWTYCGPLLTPSTLPPSLHTWSTTTTTSAPEFLHRLHPLLIFLASFLQSAGIQHYWLSIRATLPTKEYDIPRWHTDDDFLAASHPPPAKRTKRVTPFTHMTKKKDSKTSYKLSTTLLGPQSLFHPLLHNAHALRTLHATLAHERTQHPHVCTSIRCAGCSATSEAVRESLARAFAGQETVQAGEGWALRVWKGGFGVTEGRMG